MAKAERSRSKARQIRPTVMRRLKGRHNQLSVAVDVEMCIRVFDGCERGTAVWIVRIAKINSHIVIFSALSLSLIPAILQSSRTKGTNGPLGSLLNSEFVDSVFGAHADDYWGR